jgi:hypothetical protein
LSFRLLLRWRGLAALVLGRHFYVVFAEPDIEYFIVIQLDVALKVGYEAPRQTLIVLKVSK